ncbi:MFS transporter [Allokutzneria albata]|uniref:Predicted arabinose efflux permease, MFS family n=1 Tax=Allokutzneria albata TaxID=211114 RepID=A0A1G9RSM8_ALLAB|nr:MFS transporter [Allokutzneria albata]SDM25967.1 Predicted arabinose efflux permease, MFS family [Allokutzneria albata]
MRTVEARLVAAGVAVIAVTYGLGRYAYGLYLPEFRAEFDMSAATAGALASGGYAAYCLAVVVSAVLTARWSDRGTAVLAAATATVGTALIAAAGSGTALVLGVLVAGASTGLATPPLVSMVNRGVAQARRAVAQAIVNAGTGVGVLISGPSALFASGNWRVAWLFFAALSLVATVAIFLAGRDLPTHQRKAVQSGDRRIRLVIASAVVGAASAAFLTFGRDVVVTLGGFDGAQSALFWIVLGAAGIVAAVTGDVVTKVGLERAWRPLTGALAASTVFLAVVPDSVPVAVLAAAVFGASYVALTSVMVLAAGNASAVAASFLALSTGQVVGAAAVGWLIDGVGWLPAFAVAAGVALVAPAATAVTPEPKTRPVPGVR